MDTLQRSRMIPHFAPCSGRRIRRTTVVGLIALAMAGCSFAPPAQRPEMRLPARLSDDAIPMGKQHRPDAELTHQELDFIDALAPDRGLAPLVARALAANTDHRLALLQVDQARAQYRVQQADRWPTVGLSATQTRQRFDSAEQDARYGQKLVTITAGISDFELDLFGRLKSLSEAARERYLASAQGQQALRGALVAEVLRLYILERSAAQALDVSAGLRTHAAELLSIAQRQREIGLVSENDVDRIRAQDNRAAISLAQAREAHLGALRALKLLTESDLTPTGPLEPLARVPSAPSAMRDLDSRLLLQRPDVRQAESELRAAEADIGAARAAFFPSIRLSTGIGTASEGLRGLFSGGSGVWSFMPQLTLPLFDHGRRQAGLDLAQVRREASVVGYEQTVQRAFREVLEALDAQATLREAARLQADQDDRMQRRVQRAAARAQAGWVDRADLLAECIAAGQSTLARLESQRDVALNRVAVFRAFYGVSLPASVATF